MVEKCWLEASISGWAGFVLFEKMKLLKLSLKKWHLEVYGGMDSNIEQLIEMIKELDETNEDVGGSRKEMQIPSSFMLV